MVEQQGCVPGTLVTIVHLVSSGPLTREILDFMEKETNRYYDRFFNGRGIDLSVREHPVSSDELYLFIACKWSRI